MKIKVEVCAYGFKGMDSLSKSSQGHGKEIRTAQLSLVSCLESPFQKSNFLTRIEQVGGVSGSTKCSKMVVDRTYPRRARKVQKLV